MINRIAVSIIFSLFIFHFSLSAANAAEVTQSFALNAGWNAVFLEVQPASTDPEDVFDPLIVTGNLASVWMWNPNTGTVEFIQNPAQLVPPDPQMIVYIPGDPVLTNLHAIHGNTAYLIKMDADDTLDVTGEPLPPRIDWKPNSFNFVGFHLDPNILPNEMPSFESFFSSSPAHAGQEIYVLNGNGHWLQISFEYNSSNNLWLQKEVILDVNGVCTDIQAPIGECDKVPSTEGLKHGEPFWIYTKGSSTFTGPLSVQLEQGTGFHYGETLGELGITILNNTTEEKKVKLELTDESLPPGQWLYYWKFENNIAGWQEFPPSDLTIPIGESQKLRLGVRRAGLTAGTPYEANVKITDNSANYGGNNSGTRILLPASVKGISFAGLWVGDATLTKVNQPSNTADPNNPEKTGSEFSFRLILHADAAGSVTLLSQVIQMWQENTGNFVLFTDDSLIPSYSPSAMRDGQLVSRRISSPAFPNLTDEQGGMSATIGTFPSTDHERALTITLTRDDPTNPFRHMFHPGHKVEAQSFNVDRKITLKFDDVDTDGTPITGVPTLNWGSTEIGGIYSETVSGLHRDTLYIEGTFLLRKVSNIDCLTTEFPNDC